MSLRSPYSSSIKRHASQAASYDAPKCRFSDSNSASLGNCLGGPLRRTWPRIWLAVAATGLFLGGAMSGVVGATVDSGAMVGSEPYGSLVGTAPAHRGQTARCAGSRLS